MHSKAAITAAALLSLAGLTACAASITPKPYPEGSGIYLMRCSGMGRTMELCRQKAAELCPHGYIVVEERASSTLVPINGSMRVQDDDLVIECRKPPGAPTSAPGTAPDSIPPASEVHHAGQ
ncbi:MAG: hypothetical protein ACOX5Z_07860 [Desulfobulbus sp.]|jgi:hypothetical protein